MTKTVLVIGLTDVGRRTCAALAQHQIRVIHLANPSDVELNQVLAQSIEGVAVMLHNDIEALRYCLAIEHIKPGVRLFAAIFDRSVRHELEKLIPNCEIASPAFIAMPSLLAAALGLSDIGLTRTNSANNPTWQTHLDNSDQVTKVKFQVPFNWRLRKIAALIKGQMRSYDSASKALLGSFYALLSILLVDIFILMKNESFPKAFYQAASVISGVTVVHLPEMKWQLFQSGTFMLLTIIFIAVFGAGVVNHVLTGRKTGLVGRRVIPGSDHVVIVGLGQVGIRLCKELKLLNVPVVAIEKNSDAPGVQLAKDLNVPVIIGSASDVRTLSLAKIDKSKSLLAMGSNEQDNIGVAVAARSMSKEIPIIIRAGNNDAIAETKSLFSIGTVSDINGMTAIYVQESLINETPIIVAPEEFGFAVVGHFGDKSLRPLPGRCEC